MYFADLSPYRYFDGENALNIGWLDTAYEFTQGDPPAGFLHRVRFLARKRVQQTRGFHVCPFCTELRSLFTSKEWKKQDRILFETCLNDGRLSTAEFRVIGTNGKVYASPIMLVHYVESHDYLPPQEFVDAVMQATLEE